jgi:hypothetical protein
MRMPDESPEDFGARFFGREIDAAPFEHDRRAGPHQPLEAHRDILGRKQALVIGLGPDETMAAAVDEQRARQHVAAVARLEQAKRAVGIADNGRVRCSKIDPKIHSNVL